MRCNLALTLLLSFALFAKALIPSGWMPSGERAFEISVCTGAETHSLWLDKYGKLHKQDPSDKEGEKDGSCPYAAMVFSADLHAATPIAGGFALAFPGVTAPLAEVSIGHGLAAPPPPQTGPPILI